MPHRLQHYCAGSFNRKTLSHYTRWLADTALIVSLLVLAGCGGPSQNTTAVANAELSNPALPSDDSSGTSGTAILQVDAAATAVASEKATPEESDSTGESGSADASASRDGASPGQRNAGGPVDIIFEDIQLPIQEDMVFRPFMLTDRVRELDGQRIRIHGYMLPDSRTKGIKQFVLLKNLECKFGPGGQADHLLNVLMVEGVTAEFRDDPITVEGTLTVNPFQGPDGNTWSIYDLACERVRRYRPRR